MPLLNRANVGCGQTPTANWHNFDNSPSIWLAKRPILVKVLSTLGLINTHQKNFISYLRSNDIVWADVAKNIPLPNDSLEVVYTSHMLEHLDRDEAKQFLLEARRVLKPGGIIRICVPDFRIIVNNYLAHQDADKAVAETYMAISKPRTFASRVHYALVGGRHHHWMYDSQSLSKLLTSVNFSTPVILTPGETTIPNPGELNLFERSDVSLYVEAKK